MRVVVFQHPDGGAHKAMVFFFDGTSPQTAAAFAKESRAWIPLLPLTHAHVHRSDGYAGGVGSAV
jgi:hypothetical protein